MEKKNIFVVVLLFMVPIIEFIVKKNSLGAFVYDMVSGTVKDMFCDELGRIIAVMKYKESDNKEEVNMKKENQTTNSKKTSMTMIRALIAIAAIALTVSNNSTVYAKENVDSNGFTFNRNTDSTITEIGEYEVMETKCIDYVNWYREKVGSSEVTESAYLNKIARMRAEEASRKWSHVRPEPYESQRGIFSIDDRFSCPRGGNLAYIDALDLSYEDQIESSQIVCEAWRNSSTHNYVMTNKIYTKIGVGVYYSDTDGRYYVAAMFAE